MAYRIMKQKEFDEAFEKLEIIEKQRIERILFQLVEKGAIVGKPLKYKFFREKKLNGKRLLFLVYEEIQIILLLSIVNKKSQQEVIDRIVKELPKYREFVFNESKKLGFI